MMMRKIAFLALLLMAVAAVAAPLKNMPVKVVQPSGDTLYCLASGDEYYHYMHDAQGYVIMQDEVTGYYVYARLNEKGRVVPTPHVAGMCVPAELGLVPGIMPSKEYLQECRSAYEIPQKYAKNGPKRLGNPMSVVNNIVIFIRFSDEGRIPNSFHSVDSMFNDTAANAVSVHNYFKSSSYGVLESYSYFTPAAIGDSIVSYKALHPRRYYEPYSSQNPDGYVGDNDRRAREFTLLQNAVQWVNSNAGVDRSINLDVNNDGYIDNVTFVLSGTYTGWSGLLWPHQWSLYDRTVMINGKRVWSYNLQLAGSGDHYFGASTFCHEMTHSLGCPDVYHYEDWTNVSPAGSWDLMCGNGNPPQQTNAMFKNTMLYWFDSIRTLTQPGTYTLKSMASGPNNAYIIQSSTQNQYYILEYRNKADMFDASVPHSGMLIWRWNTSPNCSNANFNGTNIPHSIWLFRPDSDADTINGNVDDACFSPEVGRSNFNASTNPHPYLCDGTVDSSFSISNIQVWGDSVTFDFHLGYYNPCEDGMMDYPLVQDFESNIDCWDFVMANNDNSYWTFLEDEPMAHSGSKVCKFSSYFQSEAYGQYLISPLLQPVGSLKLKLWARSQWATAEPFRICYSTTDADTASFVHVLTDTMTNANAVWCEYEVVLPHEARYAAIHYYSNNCNFMWVDDIVMTDTLVPDVAYTLAAASYDGAMGSVSGSGTYQIGTRATITATPERGYGFSHWNDGVTTNPRQVRMMSDTSFVAFFVPVFYHVSVSANDDNYGRGAYIIGPDGQQDQEGDYQSCSTITLVAEGPVGSESFVWSDGSTEMRRDVEVTADAHYEAIFVDREAIDAAEDDGVEIVVAGRRIEVATLPGMRVELYDVMGRQLAVRSNVLGTTHFDVKGRGVYLVQVDGKTAHKVVVK